MSAPRPSGFPGVRRQPVPLSSADWVRPADGTGRLPIEVRPATEVDLAEWARDHAGTVTGWLDEHGAVLFRGCAIGFDRFAAAATALAGSAVPYRERSTPRTELAPGVYSSTEYPADQPIPLHNENSYQHVFPSRLVFCCLCPAERGGATPLADCRRVLARIDPAIVAAFRRRRIRYLRNYTEGVGLSWQEAFQQTDRDAVLGYCRQAGITAEWRPHGGLRTWQVRPAVAVHPRTGQEVWFNHAGLFHVSSLAPAVRAALLEQFDEPDLPTNVYYGDGAPIEPDVLAEIGAAYAAEAVAEPWQEGDLLLLDNLLVAHGREPFTGPRRVVVSMTGSLRHEDLPVPGGRAG